MSSQSAALLALLSTLGTDLNGANNLNSITATLRTTKAFSKNADTLAIFVTENTLLEKLKTLPCPYLAQLAEDTYFKAGAATILVAPLQGSQYKYLIIAGLGTSNEKVIPFETYRRAVAQVIRSADHYNTQSLDLELPPANLFKVDTDFLVEQTTTIANITNHKFDIFVSEKAKKTRPFNINLITETITPTIDQALNRGLIIANAVNTARFWIDLPANYLTPEILANEAQKIANTYQLKATIWNGAKVAELGMGGLTAVSQGSPQDCRFILLEYNCGKVDAPTIALVGKGITYDTGGLCLKPTAGMLNMKYDMSGAAAVIATMQAIGELKPNVNVIGCTPLAENVVSGASFKPGDIIKFYNGKTAVIGNTDAEGRLILADGLAYVTKNYKLDAVIDIATLTGAARVALGRFFSAIISEHDDLTQKVTKAANTAGDYVWRLPLTDDYKPAVKSDIADLDNAGKEAYSGGTITAACFLQNFVGKTPWVHLDIAPTAFDAIGLPYFRPNSATGAGVRLFVELLTNWDQN